MPLHKKIIILITVGYHQEDTKLNSKDAKATSILDRDTLFSLIFDHNDASYLTLPKPTAAQHNEEILCAVHINTNALEEKCTAIRFDYTSGNATAYQYSVPDPEVIIKLTKPLRKDGNTETIKNAASQINQKAFWEWDTHETSSEEAIPSPDKDTLIIKDGAIVSEDDIQYHITKTKGRSTEHPCEGCGEGDDTPVVVSPPGYLDATSVSALFEKLKETTKNQAYNVVKEHINAVQKNDSVILKDMLQTARESDKLTFWQKIKLGCYTSTLKYTGLALLVGAIAAGLLFISGGAAIPALASLAIGTKLILTFAFAIGAPSLIAYYRTAAVLTPWAYTTDKRTPIKKGEQTGSVSQIDFTIAAALRIWKLFIYGTGALPMMVMLSLPISKALGITASKAAVYHKLSHLVHGTMMAKCIVALLVLAAVQLLGASIATGIRAAATTHQASYPTIAKGLNVLAMVLECILPLSLAIFVIQAPVIGAQAIAKGAAATWKTAAAFTGIIQSAPVVPAAIAISAVNLAEARQAQLDAKQKRKQAVIRYDKNRQRNTSTYSLHPK